MKLSKLGADILSIREGVKRRAYKDTKGIWTIGVGHTGPEVVAGLVWTLDKVRATFVFDVKWAEDAANAVDSPLSQNQFDALVSFIFNIGAPAFYNSTMRKYLNAGNYEAAAKQFDRWVIPKEITGRRMSEKAQFLS